MANNYRYKYILYIYYIIYSMYFVEAGLFYLIHKNNQIYIFFCCVLEFLQQFPSFREIKK